MHEEECYHYWLCSLSASRVLLQGGSLQASGVCDGYTSYSGLNRAEDLCPLRAPLGTGSGIHGAGSEAMDELRYDVVRDVVRVVLADASGRVLLLLMETEDVPGGWWELPGGMIERDESYQEAAVREIREETGLVLDPAQVGPPTWRRDSTWHSRGLRRLQHEVVVFARVASTQPTVEDGGRSREEREAFMTYRWWRVSEITHSQKRFYPGRLPEFLPRFLAGEKIDEPFEHWD